MSIRFIVTVHGYELLFELVEIVLELVEIVLELVENLSSRCAFAYSKNKRSLLFNREP